MSNYRYCYLCASDEGLLLDIFGDGGNTTSKNLETCLSVKIHQNDSAVKKICHKCAYELDACSKFVSKYKQTRNGTSAKPRRQCSFCLEPGKKGYIFDCKDGKPVNGLAHKVLEIFDDNIFKDKYTNLSICLNCRYNLDVLFDLKCIYQTTSEKLRKLNNEGVKLSDFPKTKTRVVNRKTTYTLTGHLNGVEASDTDSSSVASMPLARKRGRPRKDSVLSSITRNCDDCEKAVENEDVMYRYHRSGRTVCRECWLSMDPTMLTNSKKKKLGLASGDIGTRRCAIILKDVLSNPAKYENIYKVEKDEHGNKTYIITDDSSESEDREKTPVKKSRKAKIIEARIARMTKAKAAKRSAISDSIEEEPPTKIKKTGKQIVEEKPLNTRSMRTRNGLVASDTEVFSTRTREATSADNKTTKTAKSDAEIVKPELPNKKRGRPLKPQNIKTLVTTSPEIRVASTSRIRKVAKIATVETPKKSERPVRKTRATSVSTDDTTSLTKRINVISQKTKTIVENISSSKSKKSKTKSLSPKNSGSEVEIEKLYVCSVCNVEYKNKLIGMKHELTHAKQPEVILERVTIPEVIVTEPSTEKTATIIEESEEQNDDVITSENQNDQTETQEKVNEPSKEVSEVVAEVAENSETPEERLPEIDSNPKPDEIVQEKNENKDDTVESQAEAPEITKTNEDTKVVENTAEITRVEETNDTSLITELEKNDDVKETEEIKEDAADFGKLEFTPNEELVNDTEEKNKPVEEALEETPQKKSIISEKVSQETSPISEEVSQETPPISENVSQETSPISENVSQETSPISEAISQETSQIPESVSRETSPIPEAVSQETSPIAEADSQNTSENPETDSQKTSQIPETESQKTSQIPETESQKTSQIPETDSQKTSQIPETDSQKTSPIPEAVSQETSVISEECSQEASKEMSAELPKESTESSVDEITVEDSRSEIEESSKVETAVENNAKDAADVSKSEENVEIEKPETVTSTTGENHVEDKIVEGDAKDVQNDETTVDSEKKPADTDETAIADDAKKVSNESEVIVKDIITEVFDLATAEVMKRIENAKSRDNEKCKTPEAETLENISREICNSSADMPSLEVPDEESAKEQV